MSAPSQSEHQVEQTTHDHQHPQRNRNRWDDLPAEIKTKILNSADPLTRYIHGLITPAALRYYSNTHNDQNALSSIWKTAFETNYSGDLRILPISSSSQLPLPDFSNLAFVKSREMYGRLCQFQPSRRTVGENTLFKFNRYSTERFADKELDRLTASLIHIPMRNCWYDMIEEMSSEYPIACARIALKYGHMKYFRHLINTYGVDPIRLVPEEEGKYDFTTHPLHNAYLVGDIELARSLHEEFSVPVDSKCVDNACTSGNLECVLHLLATSPEHFTQSAMKVSAEKGHLEIVKILYEDAHLVDIREALENALLNGHASIVGYLLSKSPETVRSDVLKWSVGRGHDRAVRIYIKYGTIAYDKATIAAIASVCHDTTLLKSLILKYPELFDEHTLQQACVWGRVDAVRLIHETLPHIKGTASILYTVCQKKHVDVVKYLIEKMKVGHSDYPLMDEAIPNFPLVRYLHTQAKSPCKDSTLSMALFHGRMDIFQYLRSHFPNVRWNSWAFYMAAMKDDMTFLQSLAKNSYYSIGRVYPSIGKAALANQNFEILEFGLRCDTDDGMDLLRYIAIHGGGDHELFSKVLSVVEKVNPVVVSRRKWNDYALRDVVRSRNTDIVRCVLSIAKDPCMFDEAGEIGSLPVLELLCAHCSPDFMPGHYAFETACLYGHLDVARYLMEHYPNSCDVDKGLDYACSGGYPSVISFLAPLASEKGAEQARKRCSYWKYLPQFLESHLAK
jgi:hypothetical protein